MCRVLELFVPAHDVTFLGCFLPPFFDGANHYHRSLDRLLSIPSAFFLAVGGLGGVPALPAPALTACFFFCFFFVLEGGRPIHKAPSFILGDVE
jgi:hypothetical protein